MYHHREPNESPHERGAETVSPDRPPQLKWMNCGYRCGWGCEVPSDDDSDGGGSDRETVSTLVELDAEGSPLMDPHDGDVEERETYDGRFESVIVIEHGSEDRHLSQLSLHLVEDDSEIADSLEVESCTTSDHSRAVSAHGSVGFTSPGPGIGVWTEDDQAHRACMFPPEYHFLRTPLRLSPQYEHCRGDPLSHRIVPDRILVPFAFDEIGTEYTPLYWHPLRM